MDADPVRSNPAHYRVAFENQRVRVLEYDDEPGDATTPHTHPDSVMITLTGFRRRLSSADSEIDVDVPAGVARWLPAQEHRGENIGDTPTHTFFVELKEDRPAATAPDAPSLGPSQG
ncbi:MAG: cytoplasmic protein [Microbacteriaceae bacterium]